MNRKRLLSFKNILLLWTIVSSAHFLFFLATPNTKNEVQEWNQEACVLKTSNYHLSTTRCRFWYTRAKFLSQAVQPRDSVPSCVIKDESPELYARILGEQQKLRTACLEGAAPLWGPGRSERPEIGWDAVGIWYARASVLYFQDTRQSTQTENFEGLVSKAFDTDFLRTYSNTEHSHYPPLVSAIYAFFMKASNSADPLNLQILQFGLLAIVILLFWLTQKKRVMSTQQICLFAVFAFLPINAVFAYTLYADLWVIFFLLSGLFFVQRKNYWIAAVLFALVPLSKNEGWFVLFATLSTLRLLDKKSFPLWMLLPALISAGYYLFFLQAPLKDADFYVSLKERILNVGQTGGILTRIMGYYLDVLFRPKLWGFLWPMTFILFWLHRKTLRFAMLPTLLAVIAIPAAFWTFPFGHKEIVLTGSNRALWQLTPMIWILWNALNLKEKSDQSNQMAA